MEQNHKLFFLKRLLLVGTPIFVIVGLIYFSAMMQADASRKAKLEAEVQSVSSLQHSLIKEDILRLTKHTRTLARLPHLEHYLSAPDHNTEHNLSHTARFFKEFMIEDGNIDQIRFIDKDGFERIRVNNNAGHPTIVGANELQNKADRYYFQRGISLKPKQVYISPLDLNIENGKIEQPLKPTIRFVTPVIYANETAGLIVINYLANELQDSIKQSLELHNDEPQILITNNLGVAYLDSHKPLGDVLLSHTESKSQPSYTLTSEVLSLLASSESGRIQTKDGIYLFQPFSFVTDEQSVVVDESLLHLKAIEFIPSKLVLAHSLLFSIAGIIQALVILFLSFSATYLIAKLALNREITAMGLVETETKRKNELMTILQAVPSGLMIINGSNRIELVNHEIIRLFGYSSDVLLHESIYTLLNNHVRENFDHTLTSFRHDRSKSVIFEYEIDGLDNLGNTIPLQIAIRKLDTTSECQCVVSIIDMTEQMLHSEQLETARKLAEQANVAKSQFLATMSHEIRTPLNVIIGLIYLLKHASLDGEQLKQVEQIDLASTSLLSLINNILDFSKIEAGEMELEQHPFSLTKLCDDISVLFDSTASDQQIQFSVNLPDNDIPDTLIGDSTRLKQVLINLISNALKFTNKGGMVNLNINASDIKDDELLLHFEVSDTGIGISQEAQATLFDAFTQADSSTTRKYGGSGLGLSIVKKLVNLMGGTIKVECVPNLGSKFSFYINVGYSNEMLENSSTVDFTNSLHIVIADDNDVDRQVLMEMSRRLGWRADVVENGESLIELVVNQVESYQQLDCIIVDWDMPDIDGLKAINSIKGHLGDTSMPAVIMVTGEEKSRLLKQMEDTIADSILTKPVDPSILFNSVNDAVAKHGGLKVGHIMDSTMIDENYSWLNETKLLVVDDSVMNLAVAKSILEKEGAEVTICESGKDAINILEKDNASFHAILMDVQMPEMDGLMTTHIIRNKLALTLPIVALSAGVSESEKVAAHEAGMDAFLPKPIQPLNVIKTLRKLISSKLKLEIAVRPKHSQISISEPVIDHRDQDGWPVIAGINNTVAKKLIGHDINFFNELVEIFLRDQADTCDKLTQLVALSPPDFAEIEAITHKLKGQTGLIGALTLSDLAGKITSMARNHDTNMLNVLNELCREHKKLYTQLANLLNQS